MVAADWAKPLFDIAQITRLTYPLPDKVVNQQTAQEIQDTLSSTIAAAAEQTSPVHRLVEGYPSVDRERLGSFRDSIQEIYEFQTEVRTVELLPAEERPERRSALIDRCLANATVLPSAALDLLELTRDTGTWEEVLELIDRLPEELRRLQFVQEQGALAASKTGQHAQSIARLETLIRSHGATPELQGLLGGRYKALYAESGRANDLDKAIAAYERGMRLDLNAYYPACNLPRLLRERGRPEDLARAESVLNIVIEACEVARERNQADLWLNATRLGVAFDLGDTVLAQDLLETLQREETARWMADSTIPDLEMSLRHTPNAAARGDLERLLDALKELPSRE